jgi:hypothetical protein
MATCRLSRLDSPICASRHTTGRRHYARAGDGLEIPITGVRAGAVTEDDVAAFARAVARRPPHPALRLAELVAVFGRACRGQGPATSIADFM